MAIIDIAVERTKRTPYMTGKAECANCHHTWIGVAPLGITELECPSCHAAKGYFLGSVLRDREVFVCNCGCDVFRISPSVGPYCVHCAEAATGWF